MDVTGCVIRNNSKCIIRYFDQHTIITTDCNNTTSKLLTITNESAL